MARRSRIEEVPVSEKTREGMSLTIDDRKFIKMQIDYVTDYVTEKMSDNIKFVAEIIIASNNKTYQYMEEIKKELVKINDRLDEHEARIKRLEDCVKLNQSA
jgi:methanogenic corrinoid protein MtbC1